MAHEEYYSNMLCEEKSFLRMWWDIFTKGPKTLSIAPGSVQVGGRQGVWFEQLLKELRRYKREILAQYQVYKRRPRRARKDWNDIHSIEERVATVAAPQPDDFANMEIWDIKDALLASPFKNFLARGIYVAYFNRRSNPRANIYHLGLAALVIFAQIPRLTYFLKRVGWGDLLDEIDKHI